ncbi:MAG: sulfotransferase family protein [Hyphomicrobiales bacterium]|nr:sulfotransferase family protein [Hyphomicrobiales bacterium]
MTLSLIGAGFGRTGTESMKLALEQLGLGRCHHMREVIDDENLRDRWRKVVNGGPADWDRLFDGFGCTVDWPSAHYWRELAAHYPDAKILLTVRSPDSWYKSFSNTILKVIESGDSLTGMGPQLVGKKIFGGRAGDRDHAISIYERNTADVLAAFPPERLLTYTVGDGWEPLCAFLGKPVPDTSFPRTNSTEQFQEIFTSKGAAGES